MVHLAEGDCFIPLLLLSATFCVCRGFWCMIKVYAWFLYKPHKPTPTPTYKAAQNVTILVSTTSTKMIPKPVIQCWLSCYVKQVIIVTEETAVDGSLEMIANEQKQLRVITMPQSDMRERFLEGIKAVTTDIIVFGDQKMTWKPSVLNWILTCFEDLKIGAVDITSASAHEKGDFQSVWNMMERFHASVSNCEAAASTHIDGGTTTIWDSIPAYRTVILKDPSFQETFKHDLWFGKPLQGFADAKHHIWRWMITHGWNTHSQICEEEDALISRSCTHDRCFVRLMLHYSRSALRSDLLSLFVTRRIWCRHPYTALVMLSGMLDPFVLLFIFATVIAFLGRQIQQLGLITAYPVPAWVILVAYILWILLSCAMELLPHFTRQPADVLYLPFWIIFIHFIAILKLYSFCTMYAISSTNEERYRQDKQERVIHHSQPQQNDIASRPFYISPYTDPRVDYFVHK